MKNRLLTCILMLSTYGMCAVPVDSIKNKKFEVQLGLISYYNGFNKSGWYMLTLHSTIVRASYTNSNNIKFGVEAMIDVGIDGTLIDLILPRAFRNIQYRNHLKFRYKSQYHFTEWGEPFPIANIYYSNMIWFGIFAGKKFDSKNWSLTTCVHLNQIVKLSSEIDFQLPFAVYSYGYDYKGTGAGVSYDLSYKFCKSFSAGWSSAFYYYRLKGSPAPWSQTLYQHEQYTPKYLMLNNFYIGFRF